MQYFNNFNLFVYATYGFITKSLFLLISSFHSTLRAKSVSRAVRRRGRNGSASRCLSRSPPQSWSTMQSPRASFTSSSSLKMPLGLSYNIWKYFTRSFHLFHVYIQRFFSKNIQATCGFCKVISQNSWIDLFPVQSYAKLRLFIRLWHGFALVSR